jgi:hypothetical protein
VTLAGRGRIARRLAPPRTYRDPKGRPGARTTEFWLAVAVMAIAVLLCFAAKIDGRSALAAVTGAAGAYSVGRGLAKR